MTSRVLAVPPALPAVLEDWVSHLKQHPSINDSVEEMHKRLIDGDTGGQYLRYLFAVYDEQAVEGSLAADNIESARMIRDKAKTIEGHPLQQEKLATIAKALGVVLRRYHLSRKERRQMVDGNMVAGDSGD